MSDGPPAALWRKWPALAARIAARHAHAKQAFDRVAATLNPHQPNTEAQPAPVVVEFYDPHKGIFVDEPSVYDPAKDAHDSYFAAIEAKRLRGDARRQLMRECPFCATPIRRVVSKARSFDPPRDYIEWHHDTPAMNCYLYDKTGPVVAATADNTDAERGFIAAWNTRSQPL